MSTTQPNVIPRPKINLSVASLINSSPSNKLLNNEKEVNEVPVCSCGFETLSRSSLMTTSVATYSLPTVANTELLYKTIIVPSVTGSKSNQMHQLTSASCPTSKPAAIKYDIKRTEQLKTLAGQLNTAPTTINAIVQSYQSIDGTIQSIQEIKTSAESSSVPTLQTGSSVRKPQTFSTIKDNVTDVSGNVALSYNNSIPTTTGSVFPTISIKQMTSSNVCSTRSKIISAQQPALVKIGFSVGNANTVSSGFAAHNPTSPRLPAIFVPRGWNRMLEKGGVTYTSPNKSRIRNQEDLIKYLLSDRTCKCGLECPLKPSEVFSFNPKVPSKFGFSADLDPNREVTCEVCKRFEVMFPPAMKLKLDGRGRKPGMKIKRAASTEEATATDRKKILLTGASPLEMFQSGMNAINSLSSVPFQALNCPVSNNQVKDLHVILNDSLIAGGVTAENNVQSLKHSNSFPDTYLEDVSCPNVSSATVLSTNAIISAIPTYLTQGTIQAVVSAGNSLQAKTEPVDMPFPKSLMGEKRRIKKAASKGRGRGTATKNSEELNLLKKKIGKKNDNLIKKATETYLQQQAALITNQINIESAANSSEIPSLKTIQTTPVLIPNQQFLANQCLLTSEGKKVAELKEIYKQLQAAVITQQLQNAVTYGKTTVILSPTGQPIAITSAENVSAVSKSNPSLSEQALHNQNTSSATPSVAYHSPHLSTVTTVSTKVTQYPPSSFCQTAVSQVTSSNVVTKPCTSGGVLVGSVTNTSNISSQPSNNQPVNRPLHSLNVTTPSVTQSSQQGQPMVVFQLVSQSNGNSKPSAAKVNTPLVRAYPVSHQQTYLHSQGQSKLIVMGNRNASQALQTLAIQATGPSGQSTTSQKTDAAQRTLQIQGVMPSQISPTVALTHVPVQYINTVNRPGYPVQYITNPKTNQVSYVYSATNVPVTRQPQSSASNFVRIAPAAQTSAPVKNTFEQDKKKQELEMLARMQEQLRKDSAVSKVPPDVMSKASSYLHTISLATSKASEEASDFTSFAKRPVTALCTSIAPLTSNCILSSSPMNIADYMNSVGMGQIPKSAKEATLSDNTSFTNLHSTQSSSTSNISLTKSMNIAISLSSCESDPPALNLSTSIPSTSRVRMTPSHLPVNISNQTEQYNNKVNLRAFQDNARTKNENGDEMFLLCDEKSTDLQTSSEDSGNNHSPIFDVNSSGQRQAVLDSM